MSAPQDDPRYRRIWDKMTRRDKCGMVARRAMRLTPAQSARAWQAMARKLEELEFLPLPKFADLLAIVLGISHGIKARKRPKK